MTSMLPTTNNTSSKPAIYPTLVIGLGGAGTNVVRHAKQRFLRSWRSHEKAKSWDDLPDVLQVLAVDTEPLVNHMGETPLYFNEFAFLGKFDATKLIANREHHPYLAWWGADRDRDIPLGYVHNGAKQLRPIGRLAFFRNYLVFQKLMTDKVRNMLVLHAVQQAEHRGFEVMRNHRLVFIVSSLCGGTGAGMFLDVAHRVRHEVGSNATVIGIFLLPSVFEGTISSHIQRRRIRANAYAALKELEYFHETQSFKALYPGEQTALPTVPYRAFSRIFLLDITNSEGVTLSNKSQIEKMAAHFIHLLTFSPLNKDILGQDVNAHSSEETTASGRHRNYSAFASGAIVMSRTIMQTYLMAAATWRAADRLKVGLTPDPKAEYTGKIYTQLRDKLKDTFRGYAVSEEELLNLGQDMARDDGRWLKFTNVLDRTLRKIAVDHGLERAKDVARRLGLKHGDSEIRPADLGDPTQFPLTRVPEPTTPPKNGFLQRLVPSAADMRAQQEAQTRYNLDLAEFKRVRTAEDIWLKLLEKISGIALSYEIILQTNLDMIAKAQQLAQEQGQEAAQQLDPLHPGEGIEVTTIYEMETGAMRDEYSGVLFQFFDRLLSNPSDGKSSQDTGWTLLHSHLCQKLLPENLRVMRPLSDGVLQGMVTTAFSQPPFSDLFQRLRTEFDIRNIVYLQYAQESHRNNGVVPPYFVPGQVMGSHVRPFAFADADLRPFSYADVDPIWLVSVPGDGSEGRGEVDQVFAQVMRDYGEFKQVYTGDGDRMDACSVVHGLPLELISSLPDLYSQYHGNEFPRSMLHLESDWVNLPEVYAPPDQEPEVAKPTKSDRGVSPGSKSEPKVPADTRLGPASGAASKRRVTPTANDQPTEPGAI